jgi:uncharacterized protein
MNPKEIDIICYHSPCQDGSASAWVASEFAKENGLEFTYVPMSHNGENKMPEDMARKNILFVDYAPVDELIETLKSTNTNFYILDHHITNQKRMDGLSNCVFDMNKSGAGLTWEYFYPGIEMPLFLQMIQDRDIWTFKINDTRHFCDGLFAHTCLTESRDELFNLFTDIYYNPGKIQEICQLGSILYKKKMNRIKRIAKHSSEQTYNYRGYKVYLCNCDHELASDLGNYIVKNYDFDFAALWRYSHTDEEYHISLRSKDDMDVSLICNEYGGGGHKNAAGCSSTIHPSVLFNQLPSKKSSE